MLLIFDNKLIYLSLPAKGLRHRHLLLFLMQKYTVCGQLAALCGRALLFTLKIQVRTEIKKNHKLQNSYYLNQTKLFNNVLSSTLSHIHVCMHIRTHAHYSLEAKVFANIHLI